MRGSDVVVLGDVSEAPIPTLRTEQVRDALAQCDCNGVARRGDLVVKVTARALRAVETTARTVAPLACAGALLGAVSQVGETWLVEVREALPFNATPEMHRVRVPRHAWQEMLAARTAQFPELRVVGWYHSHPGVGVSFSEADAFVQRYFLPADWQVACVIDPERRDVQFFSRRGRSMGVLGAFWVERGGGEATEVQPKSTAPAAPVPVRASNEGRGSVPQSPEVVDAEQASETFLKDRFVERSLKQILGLLKEPPLSVRDFAMLGLMGLMVVVLIFTRVGASSNSAELEKITARLDEITQRLDAMQAAAPVAPVRKTPARVRPSARPSDTALAAPATTGASGVAGLAPSEGEPDVEHVIKKDESLWSVAEEYYGDGSKMTALMRYNGIKDARELVAGASIKVPPLSRLRLVRSTPGDDEVPPPTPH